MANQTFNSEDARAALKNALSANSDLISTFNDATKNLQTAFTSAGGAVGGNLGEAAANSFADSAGDMFSKDLTVRTEEFLESRVPELLKSMEEFNSATTNAYSNAVEGNGTTNS